MMPEVMPLAAGESVFFAIAMILLGSAWRAYARVWGGLGIVMIALGVVILAAAHWGLG